MDTAVIVAVVGVVGAVTIELIRKMSARNDRDHAMVVEKISGLAEESKATREDIHDLKGDVRELKADHRGLRELFRSHNTPDS